MLLPLTFHYGNGTEDHSLGVVDVPCVVGGKPIRITMHVVLGEVPCLLSKGCLRKMERSSTHSRPATAVTVDGGVLRLEARYCWGDGWIIRSILLPGSGTAGVAR